MKKIGLFLLMVAFCLKVSAQAPKNDTLKFAAAKKEMSIFLNLVHVAGLDTIYSGRPITIFAPDNKAFAKLSSGMLDSLSTPASRQRLIALLNGHIIAGELSAKQIGQLIHQNNGHAALNTLSGKRLIAKVNVNRNISLTNESTCETIVSQFDIHYLNTTFFIITAVLAPEK